MIVLYHQDNKVVSIWNQLKGQPIELTTLSITESLFSIAELFPSSLVVWCHISQKEHLNVEAMGTVFHHPKIMASFTPDVAFYLGDSIGYVEESHFLRINKEMQYATWLMSSVVGGISSVVLQAVAPTIIKHEDFDCFLLSFAKVLMPKGLLCYSEPSLLKADSNGKSAGNNNNASSLQLFRFVKEHYRARWVFILFLDLILYEKKIRLLPLLYSLFYRQSSVSDHVLDTIIIKSSQKTSKDRSVDVIIPTIGRKKYLYDVLCDLRMQTHLPNKIIIVEQNTLADSTSELDYLMTESWPFPIDFVFTHQAGACNARNIALSKIQSNWIFLADDDIRLANDFFEDAFETIDTIKGKAFTFSCLRQGERIVYDRVFQWYTFGSGCSIVEREALRGRQFDMRYEFGFGEDADFGMQLRNNGYDVLYLPKPEILHLKAPIGGFRTKPQLAWHNDPIQPKPSPTVMLFKRLHNTPKQLLGYKTVLFFKFYKHQPIRNPFGYYKKFQQQWKQSIYWAKRLSQ